MGVGGRLKGSLAAARARIGRGTSARGFYAAHLRYDDLAFDIGANNGIHTAAMVRRGARVIAVEPQVELANELTSRFPEVTVLPLAVGEKPGAALLHTSSANHHYATLNDSWVEIGQTVWDGSRSVEVTTLDELIVRYGRPRIIKIDVEGFEDRVLAGLSWPAEQVLFEMHRPLLDVAQRSLSRLDELGRYEYRLMPHAEHEYGHDPWILEAPVTAREILAEPPRWADVYARLR